MFRKFLLTLAGVFAAMLSYAYSPAIRQIKLDVELLEDGSARVQDSGMYAWLPERSGIWSGIISRI